MLSVRQMNESMNAHILMIEDDERLAKMVGTIFVNQVLLFRMRQMALLV